MKNFDSFGVMIDMSRNAVMSMDGLKKFMVLLGKMGYNCIMLYTEDTYEVDGEPYFGYMRGRYTKQEMKEIDAFAKTLGMEVIPCIQALAHLNAIKRWKQYPFDCTDILLADDERTYELIDHMFSTLSECFTSRRIHIGMDEAHMLGKGKHLDIHGYETVDVIIKRHLDRVCKIADKYGYKPMIWSDMFFRSWNGGSYRVAETKIPEEYVKALPSSVIPVYWDYYNTNEEVYIGMIKNHKQLSDKTWFAGGAWCWQGMIPHNRYSLDTMIPALNACKKEGIRNVVMTLWGDDGAECSHFAQLSALFYLAEYAKGNTDEQKIKDKFKRFCGIDYDSFMTIDAPNEVIPYSGKPFNPSKYMLFSDYFNGFLDYTIASNGKEYYESCAKELYRVAKSSRKYGYVFDSAAKLCDVLAVKYDLGVRTRNAYEADDREALRSLADNEYASLVRLIERYTEAFRKQWMAENKPQGFDVQEMRLGGLLMRTKSCRRRLLDYVNGKLGRIDELEEELLPYGEKESGMAINRAPVYATVNVVFHNPHTL